jgi:hypothetical protein
MYHSDLAPWKGARPFGMTSILNPGKKYATMKRLQGHADGASDMDGEAATRAYTSVRSERRGSEAGKSDDAVLFHHNVAKLLFLKESKTRHSDRGRGFVHSGKRPGCRRLQEAYTNDVVLLRNEKYALDSLKQKICIY